MIKGRRTMNKTILQARELFKVASFDYAICGGYALDLFAGKELRTHGDFDIVIYKEDKISAFKFLENLGWSFYGRFMEEGRPVTQHLFYKIDDIADSYWDDCKNMWAIKPGCLPDVLHKLDRLQGSPSYASNPASEIYTYQSRKWLVQDEIEFIEFEVDARDGENFILQEKPRIARSLDKAILYRDSVPYLAPEIVLFYKSDKFSSEHPNVRPKTEGDFNAIMPMLSPESKEWLFEAIERAYPDGCGWLEWLLG